MIKIEFLTDAFRRDVLTRAEKRRLLKLMVVGVVAALSDVFVVSLLYPFIALLSGDASQSEKQNLFGLFNAESNKEELMYACLALVFGYILRMIVFFIYKRGVAQLRRDIQIRFSSLVFDSYLKRNYEFYSSTNTSETIRIISAIGGYLGVYIFGVLTLVSELTLGLGLIALVTVISPESIIPALVVCAVLGFVAHRSTRSKMKHAGARANDAVSGRLRIMQEGFSGISEIKLYSKEQLFKEEFAGYQSRAADAESDFEVYSGLTSPLFELVLILSLIAFTSIYVSTSEDFSLILPTLALLAGAAFRVIPSFGRLINYMQNLDFGRATADELRALAESAKPRSRFEDSLETLKMSLSAESPLKLVNLCFAYQTTQVPVIKHINMEFEHGKVYCISGGSGSGKSTLVALILGLLKPTEGDVCVGNRSISESLQTWQKSIGYVPQTIFLRDDTIRSNITLGDSLDEPSKLKRVISHAGLETFLDNQPDGFDTKVGESGSRISGGERQRIGIARALYREPSVLVFDEATSALDQETEDQILDTIFEMRGNITIIILSHNPAVIERCDVVYSLQQQ